jgi:outer membrane murein-binding lipoprotein Lpp
MRKILVLAALALATAGCADKAKLNTALAESQRLSAEKDSLLNEVLANAEMVSAVNTELGKVKDLGANPVTAGEGAGTANDQRTVVLGKIRDAITRLQTSEESLEKAKQRLAAMSTKDSRLVAQVDRYQKTIEEMKLNIERQQAEYTAIIDSQNTQIVTLRTDLDTVSAAKSRIEAEKAALADTMNTVYYVAGTQSELVEKGVAVKEGSKFLIFGGSKLLPARNLDPSAFTVLHRMSDTVLTLPRNDKQYKIVTRQSPTHLSSLVANDGKVSGGELHIASPEQFWAGSRYLILVQD